MFDCNPVSDPVCMACDWPGKLRAYPWWPGTAATHWHGRSRTVFNSIHLCNVPFFLSVWSVNILIYQVQLNTALIDLFFLKTWLNRQLDSPVSVLWYCSIGFLFVLSSPLCHYSNSLTPQGHGILCCEFQKDLLAVEEWCDLRISGVGEQCAGLTIDTFLFWGRDLSWQDLRVSPLLASGRKYQRSETSLSKSLGKGIIRAIWHPRRGLCS